MEDYFRAKERLFGELLDEGGTAVINLDDPYGKRLGAELRRSRDRVDILTYGLDLGADITAGAIGFSTCGVSFKISFGGGEYDVSSGLTGLPNVYNIMSAVGVSVSLGIPWKVILDGIGNLAAVPGRFEKIDAGQKFLCVIDYAHTEDALERLIYTAKGLISFSALSAAESRDEGKGCSPLSESTVHRIITVFGCGGDRDRGKRPKMGEIATRLSDRVIVTSDNPRSEDPANIIKDILGGAVVDNYLVEPDRKKAIELAVGLAGDGDIVLIAGKGHEDYQEINGVRCPFRDKDVAAEAIKTRHANPGIGK
jgi:UDP-N-acetylmuramoyl-L-alanyl-D-glutamate--2,6-diaminopimelate ligase